MILLGGGENEEKINVQLVGYTDASIVCLEGRVFGAVAFYAENENRVYVDDFKDKIMEPNNAEVAAAILAIRIARKLQFNQLRIFSDSEFLVNNFKILGDLETKKRLLVELMTTGHLPLVGDNALPVPND